MTVPVVTNASGGFGGGWNKDRVNEPCHAIPDGNTTLMDPYYYSIVTSGTGDR